MAKGILYSETPTFDITTDVPGQNKKYFVKASYKKFTGATNQDKVDNAIASNTLGQASDPVPVQFLADAPEAPTELASSDVTTKDFKLTWVQNEGEYTAVSWVVFLGNDMSTPLKYVETKEALLSDDSWVGKKEQFSVGAFPMKTTGTPEEQMQKAVTSGRMSPLSAPLDVQFKSSKKTVKE